MASYGQGLANGYFHRWYSGGVSQLAELPRSVAGTVSREILVTGPHWLLRNSPTILTEINIRRYIDPIGQARFGQK